MKEWDISFINTAWLLGRNNIIHLEDVPDVLQRDLITFMFGKTVSEDEKGIVIHKSDYLAWLTKLNTQGFDYDIQLNEKKS
jgi:hypothetical protein